MEWGGGTWMAVAKVVRKSNREVEVRDDIFDICQQ